jgi:hypothetical protein
LRSVTTRVAWSTETTTALTDVSLVSSTRPACCDDDADDADAAGGGGALGVLLVCLQAAENVESARRAVSQIVGFD